MVEKSTFATTHPVPPLAAVDVTTLPVLSAATHNAEDAQEAVSIDDVPAIRDSCHEPAPPVGSVEEKIAPVGRPPPLVSPRATQNDADAQATPNSSVFGPRLTERQAPAPPLGSVETITSPVLSTAAQNETDGHDNP
jgi:hypothetical protein